MGSPNSFKKAVWAELEHGYTPCPEVALFAKQQIVTPIVGVTCVGKDTVMKASGLPVVKGVTSRDERPEEAAKRLADEDASLYEHKTTPGEREELLEYLRTGQFVQVIIHPNTNELYGTLPRHFAEAGASDRAARVPLVMDVTAREFLTLREERLFGRINGVCLTAPPEVWLDRRQKRDDRISCAEKAARTKEALHSLAVCLNPDVGMSFVLNNDIDEAASAVRQIAEGRKPDDNMQYVGRMAGYLMLDYLVPALA